MDSKALISAFFGIILILTSCKSDRVDAATYKSREKLVLLGNDFTEEGFISAIKENKLDVVKLYIESGISPDSSSKIGETQVPAIFFALDRQLDLAVQMLVKAGANVKKSVKGVSVLMKAVEKGNTATIELIIKNGADVNQSGDNGLTPLMVAIERGNMDAFFILVRSGADINKGDNSGITPLMRAVRNGNVEMTRELLKKGVDIKSESDNGLKVEKAISEKNSEEMKILLNKAGLKID